MKRYEVEVDDSPKGFKFRMACSDGRITPWALYTQVVQIDDVCAATQYYMPPGRDCLPITMRELVESFSLKA